MAIIDKRVHRFAAFARKPIVLALASVPSNQANVGFLYMLPMQGFPAGQPPYAIYGYTVERVEVFCTAVTATSSVRVQIQGQGGPAVTTGNITPVAGTVVAGVLAIPGSTIPGRGRMKFTDSLGFNCTTDGTGTITNLMVTITIRPIPMADEAA